MGMTMSEKILAKASGNSSVNAGAKLPEHLIEMVKDDNQSAVSGEETRNSLNFRQGER